jgi:uncharacterized protein YndB with AHSA1/START domain
MAEKTHVATNLEDRTMVVERTFDAPREIVFRAWSEADRLKEWWGPKGWTLPVCNIDFRPGGVWHYCMEGPGGEKSWGRAVYDEIVPPERIVYTDAFSDEQGGIAPGMPVMKIVIDFVDEGGKTKIVSRTEFDSREALESILQMGVVEGLTETWDRLEEYLAKSQ